MVDGRCPFFTKSNRKVRCVKTGCVKTVAGSDRVTAIHYVSVSVAKTTRTVCCNISRLCCVYIFNCAHTGIDAHLLIRSCMFQRRLALHAGQSRRLQCEATAEGDAQCCGHTAWHSRLTKSREHTILIDTTHDRKTRHTIAKHLLSRHGVTSRNAHSSFHTGYFVTVIR